MYIYIYICVYISYIQIHDDSDFSEISFEYLFKY